MWASEQTGCLLSYDISGNTMSGNRYEQVLNQHDVLPRFMIPEMDLAIFKQDGAAPHFANPFKQFIHSSIY